MSHATLVFHNEPLLLDPAGAVFWPSRRILVVADLHFEKASAAASRGSLLPPYDTRVTLEKLHRLMKFYQPIRIIALGDSFHDNNGLERMSPADRARLTQMASESPFTWIIGNHDSASFALPGERTAELREEPFVFRHQADFNVALHGVEISGHYHPKAVIVTRARRVMRPCFVTDSTRLMLPSFGTYTGGLDIRNRAIARHFPRGFRVFLQGQDKLFSFNMKS